VNRILVIFTPLLEGGREGRGSGTILDLHSLQVNMSSKMKNKSAAPAEAAKKRQKSNYDSYSTYIYKVLKQCHPDNSISTKAMAIMGSFVEDMFARLSVEAGRLARYNRHATVSARDVQAAVRLHLPGELGKHAMAEGTKAVTQYTASKAAKAGSS
jgi:histone H2B